MQGLTFDAPRHKLLVHRTSFAATNASGKATVLERVIGGHPYNNQLELFVAPPAPGAGTASAASSSATATATAGLAALSKAVGGAFHYRVTSSVSALLAPSFLQAHVRTGAWHCVSVGTPIDHTPVSVSWGPDGVLRLSVDRDTYERLGLIGAPTALYTGTKPRHNTQRWNIAIDALATSFAPGNALYDRVVMCLGADRVSPLTFIAAWQSAAGVCGEVKFPAGVLRVARIDTATAAPLAFCGPTHAITALPAVDTLHDAVTKLDAAATARAAARPPVTGDRVRPLAADGKTVLPAPPAGGDSAADADPDRQQIDALTHDLADWLGAMACRTYKVLQYQTTLPDAPPPPPLPGTGAVAADWSAPTPVSALSTKPSLSRASLKQQLKQQREAKQAARAAAAVSGVNALPAQGMDFMSFGKEGDADADADAGAGGSDEKKPTAIAAVTAAPEVVSTGAFPASLIAATGDTAASASASASALGSSASGSAIDAYVCSFAFHALPFRSTAALASTSSSSAAAGGGVPVSYRWRGLLVPAHVYAAVSQARALVDGGSAAWCAVMVWGFADVNVSWLTHTTPPPNATLAPTPTTAAAPTAAAGKGKSKAASGKAVGGSARQRQQRAAHAMGASEHDYSAMDGCGENDYMVVVMPGNRFWLYVLSTGSDTYS